jgi:hypothetical protein
MDLEKSLQKSQQTSADINRRTYKNDKVLRTEERITGLTEASGCRLEGVPRRHGGRQVHGIW